MAMFRAQAAAKALGLDVNRLVFIIYQMVTMLRGGEEIRMSKSSGSSLPSANSLMR